MFLERKLGVLIFSSLFKWDGISPDENDFEWQSQRKNHQKNGFSFARNHLPCRKFIWSGDLLFSFFHWSGITLFSSNLSFLLSSDLLIENPSFPFFYFSFFSFLPFLSFCFSLSISFFGKSGFSILFALPWGDSAVLCFGEGMRILFYRPRFQKVLRLCLNGGFYRGSPILISGAKQIWVSRCWSRADLPYHSIRHAWQWWFENNVQN